MSLENFLNLDLEKNIAENLENKKENSSSDFFIFFFIFFLIVCYSKGFFLYDEELIIITCLFIVFFSLNFLLKESVKKFFEKKLQLLNSSYVDQFTFEKEAILKFKDQVNAYKTTCLNLGFILLKIKVSFLYFFSLNFKLYRIYIKFLAKDFLVTMLYLENSFFNNLEEKASLKTLKNLNSSLKNI